MKKKTLSSYYIMVMVFCQLFLFVGPVFAINREQEINIVSKCDDIKKSLRELQKNDSTVRNYLGNHYENILNKYMIPLNSGLIKNSISIPNVDLADNQIRFKVAKNEFAGDYTEYQKRLEELLQIQCDKNPFGFYDKLTETRTARDKVYQDTLTLSGILSDHERLVTLLRSNL